MQDNRLDDLWPAFRRMMLTLPTRVPAGLLVVWAIFWEPDPRRWRFGPLDQAFWGIAPVLERPGGEPLVDDFGYGTHGAGIIAGERKAPARQPIHAYERIRAEFGNEEREQIVPGGGV